MVRAWARGVWYSQPTDDHLGLRPERIKDTNKCSNLFGIGGVTGAARRLERVGAVSAARTGRGSPGARGPPWRCPSGTSRPGALYRADRLRRRARRAAASSRAQGADGRGRGSGQASSRQHDRPDSGGHLRKQRGLRHGAARLPGQDGEAAAGPGAAAHTSLALAVQHSVLASRV